MKIREQNRKEVNKIKSSSPKISHIFYEFYYHQGLFSAASPKRYMSLTHTTVFVCWSIFLSTWATNSGLDSLTCRSRLIYFCFSFKSNWNNWRKNAKHNNTRLLYRILEYSMKYQFFGSATYLWTTMSVCRSVRTVSKNVRKKNNFITICNIYIFHYISPPPPQKKKGLEVKWLF